MRSLLSLFPFVFSEELAKDEGAAVAMLVKQDSFSNSTSATRNNNILFY